jgi:hypothetical protein
MFTIDEYREAETLMRALLRFKFECPQEAEMFAGSPIMAQIMVRLLESMKSAQDGEGEERARAWREKLDSWYSLSGREREREVIVDYVRSIPQWSELDDAGQRKVLADLAAPFSMDEDLLGEIRAAVYR